MRKVLFVGLVLVLLVLFVSISLGFFAGRRKPIPSSDDKNQVFSSVDQSSGDVVSPIPLPSECKEPERTEKHGAFSENAEIDIAELQKEFEELVNLDDFSGDRSAVTLAQAVIDFDNRMALIKQQATGQSLIERVVLLWNEKQEYDSVIAIALSRKEANPSDLLSCVIFQNYAIVVHDMKLWLSCANAVLKSLQLSPRKPQKSLELAYAYYGLSYKGVVERTIQNGASATTDWTKPIHISPEMVDPTLSFEGDFLLSQFENDGLLGNAGG